jgi:hypothetical protein
VPLRLALLNPPLGICLRTATSRFPEITDSLSATSLSSLAILRPPRTTALVTTKCELVSCLPLPGSVNRAVLVPVPSGLRVYDPLKEVR